MIAQQSLENDVQATRLRLAVETVIGHQFVDGNRIDVLRNGDQIFPAMLEAVEQATESIEFVTFVYWKGDIARRMAGALADRARHGVRVRVILDGFGTLPMDPVLIDDMRSAGVMVERFRPIVRWKFWESDHRTHRKILVCDNQVAFTGGVGIAEEWMGDARDPSEWRDTHFRIEGPAVIGLRAAFLTDWRDIGFGIDPIDIDFTPPHPAGSVPMAVIDGSAQIGYNDAERVLESLVVAAEEKINLATPYFNPTTAFTERLIDARRRGVGVDILIPGPHIDKRISLVMAREKYRPLIREGIRVWEFQPTMMHVKSLTVDGRMAMIGSVNINRRSVEKDEEVAVVVLDDDVVAQLDDHFAHDLERSASAAGSDTEPNPGHRLVAKLVHPIRREL